MATLTREKCSALVRSCYIPSRTSCNSEDIISNVDDGLRRRKQHQPYKRHGGLRSCTAVSSEPCQLKSNLKIKNGSEKGVELEQRKVSWPDAYGKDIAHIQEFEHSESEDEANAGNSKRKYCGVCMIQ